MDGKFACAFAGAIVCASHSGWAADAALIEAAKKEGSVTWYTTQIVDQLARPAANAFEKKYGMKVNLTRADSLQVALRLSNEAKAGKMQADVYDSTSISLAMKEQKIPLKWQPDAAKTLPKQFSDPEGYWTAGSGNVITTGYNTNLVPKGTQPKTYADLLDDKWKGRMVWNSQPGQSSGPGFVGTVLAAMGEDKGMDYLRKLSKQKVTGLQQAARQVLDQVIAGEYAIGLQIFNNHAFISAGQGAPTDWQPLEKSMRYSLVFSVTREAPHPNAGKLFADFMTSKDGQIVFREADYMTVDPDVPPKTPELLPDGGKFEAIYFTPEQLESQMPKWTAVVKELF